MVFRLRGPMLSAAIGVASGMCFFLYGYDQGNIGGILTMTSFLTQFPALANLSTHKAEQHTAGVEGFTVAAWNLGCFISAMVAVFVGDILGRKKMIMLGLTLLLIGEVVQCSAFNLGQLIVGRMIAGFGNGFNCSTVPAWQAECTKAYRRGTVLMISAGAMTAAGMAFSYWMDFAFAWTDPSSAAWRVPLALQIAFILLVLGFMTLLPESPRWLILQGRETQALDVLSALNDSAPDNYEIQQEFLQIKDAVLEMAKARFSNVFRMGDYRHLHRVTLAVLIQFMQQIGGINFMTQYFAQMFEYQYVWTAPKARLLAACAGTEFFLASFIAVWCIDRVAGRRGLLVFGSSGMLVSMIVLSIMLWLGTRASLNVGTAFVFVFCTFYAIGWQGISWLYQVEIVPLRIRGPANALSTAANWLGNFIVVMVTPIAFVDTTWKTYLIFVSTNAVIIPTVYFFYPETSLRCLEEIDYIFHAANNSPKPWLDVKRIAADAPLWYGDSEQTYDYETSEWHQRLARSAVEGKDLSEDEKTLRQASSGGETALSSKYMSSSSSSDNDDTLRAESPCENYWTTSETKPR